MTFKLEMRSEKEVFYVKYSLTQLKTLLRGLKEKGLKVESFRFPSKGFAVRAKNQTLSRIFFK